MPPRGACRTALPGWLTWLAALAALAWAIVPAVEAAQSDSTTTVAAAGADNATAATTDDGPSSAAPELCEFDADPDDDDGAAEIGLHGHAATEWVTATVGAAAPLQAPPWRAAIPRARGPPAA